MIYIGFDYDLKDEDVLDEDDIDRGNNGVNAGEDCSGVPSSETFPDLASRLPPLRHCVVGMPPRHRLACSSQLFLIFIVLIRQLAP